MICAILSSDVFDVTTNSSNEMFFEFNLRKLVKFMNSLDDSFLYYFATEYQISYEDVEKAFKYVKAIPQCNMRSKVVQALEKLKHSEFAAILLGGK